MPEDIEIKVKRIVGDFIGLRPHELGRDYRLEKLGFDSLDMAALAIDIEDAFSIELEPAQIGEIKTIDDLIQAIEKAELA
jgi:acyl carrier protein